MPPSITLLRVGNQVYLAVYLQQLTRAADSAEYYDEPVCLCVSELHVRGPIYKISHDNLTIILR